MSGISVSEIKEKVPWAFEKNQSMIIGDDIDAIMSACFLHHFLNWNIKGFYVGYHKLFIESVFDRWEDSIFVDLDISQNKIKSIGHHILQINKYDKLEDIGHQNSLNPNLLRNITMEKFGVKYPLGTIHFLMWLHNFNIEIENNLQKILWVPDSAWINGQSHRFRENVYDWIGYFNLQKLERHFEETDTKEFERIMEKIVYAEIKKAGFNKGYGQVSSRHLKLKGFQCQFDSPNMDANRIKNLIQIICNIFNWDAPNLPEEYNKMVGTRKSNDISVECYQKGLSQFIRDENIFSYVIPNYNKINYTIFSESLE